MKQVRDGKTVSLSNETITCGGGKFYTGFTEMPERVPGFVSLKEKYKKTPEMVIVSLLRLTVMPSLTCFKHLKRQPVTFSVDAPIRSEYQKAMGSSACWPKAS